jgi:hypothetical protein
MLLVVVGAACVLFYVRDPADGGPFPSCPFRAVTGHDCPLCGTGRALHQLLHGDVVAAFGLNPLALIAVGLGALWLTLPAVRVRPTQRWVVAAGVVIAAFWTLRNLAWGPVAWMSSVR